MTRNQLFETYLVKLKAGTLSSDEAEDSRLDVNMRNSLTRAMASATIATTQATAAGHIGFQTLSTLNASLAYAANTLAEVTNDAANNGLYIKVGASGTGSWLKSTNDVSGRVTDLEVYTVQHNGNWEVTNELEFASTLKATGNTLVSNDEVINLGQSDARYTPRYAGANLVRNGFGELGTADGWSGMSYQTTDRPPHLNSSLTMSGSASVLTSYSGQRIRIDPRKVYKFEHWAKRGSSDGLAELGANAGFYSGVRFYDAAGLLIEHWSWKKHPTSTDTTLAAPLNVGDTTMTLTNATGWANGTSAFERNLVYYPYTNASGYTHADYTYSRNRLGDGGSTPLWLQGGVSGNVITLRVPYAGAPLAAGTKVRNCSGWGGFPYVGASAAALPTTWTQYNGYIGQEGGYDGTINELRFKIPPTAVFAEPFFLSLSNTGGALRWSVAGVDFREAQNVLTNTANTRRSLQAIDDAGVVTTTVLPVTT